MTMQTPAPVWQTMVHDGLYAVTVYAEDPSGGVTGKGSLQIWHAGTGDLLHNVSVPVLTRDEGPTTTDIWLWRGHALRFIEAHLNGGDAAP
jgi:hypothetical protein